MNIDPELLRQIQVEGITDDDYRRVGPKIEAVKQMEAIASHAFFIFDLFKMRMHYVSSNHLGWDDAAINEINKDGNEFLDCHLTSGGKELMWRVTAYIQNFYKNLPEENRKGYVVHCNQFALSQQHKRILNTKFIPLEYAPDGRVWLTLEVFTTLPENRKEPFCIHNVRTGELRVYDPKAGAWVQKSLPVLTPMEKRVLSMLATGCSLKEVSDYMCKSQDTIKTYRARIFKKLDVHNVHEAIEIAKNYWML